MQGELGKVLQEERERAHQPPKDHMHALAVPVALEEGLGVVDAEGVHHSGQQHVLSQERQEVVCLHVGHCVLQMRLGHPQLLQQHVEREDKISHHEKARDRKPYLEVWQASHNNDDKKKV